MVLSIKNASVIYPASDGRAPVAALQSIDLTLQNNDFVVALGASGCGKSTLLNLIAGFLSPSSGEILLDGRDLLKLDEEEMRLARLADVALVTQAAMNALNPVRTVGDQIAEAIHKHLPEFPKEQVTARVTELLDLVGIAADHRDHFPHQYSGGMRQRAMIAMALACNPKVIIADEPTTALDVMIQAQILELLDSLRKKLGLAIVFVTHDLGVVAEMCDKVLVMYGGVTAEFAPVDVIYNDARHPYTQELLKAFPDLTKPKKKLSSIPGYPPRLDALPPGCRFAPRCPAVFDRCRVEQPALYKVDGNGHIASCHLIEASK